MNEDKVVYKELSYKINGLLFKTHKDLGRYRNEKQYADMLEELFRENNIKYIREVSLPESFKGERSKRNIPDFIVEDKIIIDLKAKPIISKDDYFQMRRYLASCNKKLGIKHEVLSFDIFYPMCYTLRILELVELY